MKKCYNKKKKSYNSLLPVHKKVNEFIEVTYDLFDTTFYEPRITNIMLLKDKYKALSDAVLEQTDSFNPRLSVLAMEKIPFIKESLTAWYSLFKRKIEPFIDGNQYLKDLPMHKDPSMFYLMVKELNPINIVLKHPLTVIQASFQAGRSIKDIIAFDEKDPISARRSFDPDDRGNAPGSRIFIESGHHRTYEIYKRYLLGKVDGDILIPVKKGEY
jgi:hypothetical protein